MVVVVVRVSKGRVVVVVVVAILRRNERVTARGGNGMEGDMWW